MADPDFVDTQRRTIAKLRRTFASGKTRPLEWRLAQLEALRRCLRESEGIFIDALQKDLRKHANEVRLTEFCMVYHDIELAVHNLHKWIKPINVEKPNLLAFGLDTTQLVPEPYGLVLEIAPWNYPVQLALVPLIGSIAAGNCFILKPSEVGPHCEQAFAEVLPKYLDTDAFAVITGGPQETTALLENQFDYIFYTGSTTVGKIIMSAAAKHLTPVTLELGGKSPTIVDDTCDLYMAARRIAWGKWINAGQSCIAPDYILVQENVEKQFIEQMQAAITHFFGQDAQKSDSYGRIVANRHWRRITSMIQPENVIIGGKSDEQDLYIEPTLVRATPNDAIMQDEIFGPVLPILTVPNIETAIDFINQRPKPLACYMFSSNKSSIDRVLYNTTSGAFVSNDTMMQASVNTLPFGGVGPSGIGGYHGKFSFDTFSHMKPVVKKYAGLEFANEARYAPYTESKFKQIAMFLGYPDKPASSSWLKPALLFSVVFSVVLAGYYHSF